MKSVKVVIPTIAKIYFLKAHGISSDDTPLQRYDAATIHIQYRRFSGIERNRQHKQIAGPARKSSIGCLTLHGGYGQERNRADNLWTQERHGTEVEAALFLLQDVVATLATRCNRLHEESTGLERH